MTMTPDDTGSTRLGGDRGTTDVRRGGADTEVRPQDTEVLRQDRVTHETPVNVNVPAQRGDQVRWGPVWAGLLVALATFLLLELAFFALGWLTLDPGQNEPGTSAGWISGLIGLFAFFLGGLTAGATAMWKGLDSGLLHGILVWALGVVAFLFLTLFGGGQLLGTFGDLTTRVINLGRVTGNVSPADVQSAVDNAKSAASWAVLGLGLAVVASALGGVLGSKIWPRGQAAGDRNGRI